MNKKQDRQKLIIDLIGKERIFNQEQLLVKLEALGVSVTQTTLSRDLNELHILKGPQGYVVSDSQPLTGLERLLRTMECSIHPAANILVLKTQPGVAQMFGFELDNADLPLAVGTIAGDDTVMIATGSDDDCLALGRQLKAMADGRSSS